MFPLNSYHLLLGPSPIPSHDRINYYVIFVDHYTKYIWLFPIKIKSDVASIFTCFKLVVQKFFQRPIILCSVIHMAQTLHYS